VQLFKTTNQGTETAGHLPSFRERNGWGENSVSQGALHALTDTVTVVINLVIQYENGRILLSKIDNIHGK
jgi:hypothetical protein